MASRIDGIVSRFFAPVFALLREVPATALTRIFAPF
jgi:hypothetical protein